MNKEEEKQFDEIPTKGYHRDYIHKAQVKDFISKHYISRKEIKEKLSEQEEVIKEMDYQMEERVHKLQVIDKIREDLKS